VVERLKMKKHYAIIVAERAEEDGLLNPMERIIKVDNRDNSGNLNYDDNVSP
jgi:hypothetical protein